MEQNPWKEQSPQDLADKLKKKEKLHILDVREPDEWESGHIAEAKHFPLGEIPERHGELDKEKEYILVCRSGGRSTRACEFLHGLGYKVINMTGGMNAWTGETKTGRE